MNGNDDKRVLPLVAGCLVAAFVATAAFGQSRRDFGSRESSSGRDSGRDSRSSDRSPSDRPSFDRFGGSGRSSSSSSGAAPTTRPAFGPNVSIDRYAALTSKNIFMKDRRPPRAPSTQQSQPTFARPPERTPQQTYRLTGLALQEGRNVAFIEDIRSGKTERKVQGDAVAGGTIVQVDLDALEYEADGKRVRVGIGYDLTGAVASPISVAESSSSSPTTQPSGAGSTPAVDPNDPTLSIIERLKAQRAAQGGR